MYSVAGIYLGDIPTWLPVVGAIGGSLGCGSALAAWALVGLAAMLVHVVRTVLLAPSASTGLSQGARA